MSSQPVHLRCENIGGIEETEVAIPPGVTVLSGRNATNRSSLLHAIMGVLGSDNVSLKADSSSGFIELERNGERYERELTRTNGTVRYEGEPYLDDSTAADVFAFLLEDNRARRAVERGEDLWDVIMEPVDTAELTAEISQHEARKRQLNERLQELENLESDLADKKARRIDIRESIDETRGELQEIEQRIDEMNESVEGSREKREALEDAFDERQRIRSDIEDVRYTIETQTESISALESEQSDIEEELESLPDPDIDPNDVQSRIDDLRTKKSTLESQVSDLRSVIQFNREHLEREDSILSNDGGSPDGGESVTDRLVQDEVTCWTCGRTVQTDRIEDTIDTLTEQVQSKLNERNEVESKLSDLREDLEEQRRTREKRSRLTNRLEEVSSELDSRRSRLSELEEKKDALESELTDIQERIDDMEQAGGEDDEILELHRDANTLEIDIQRKENELESLSADIKEIEDKLSKRETLQSERHEVAEELQSLRNRIRDLETRAVEAFNDHMESILDLLDYENLERIWIERHVANEHETVPDGEFTLHVIRQSADGRSFEDTVDHLSESERDVTGLIFALAGYLVHDVADDCPFLLLDSLEAVDARRIGTLVEYISEYAAYLVVALLPEDASAVDTPHETITDI
ncbi:MAG: archaea-specific SMC-related protein [Halodesulfurarchaeum sp.]